MFEYIKGLLNSDDICVQIALMAVISIISLLIIKYIIDNYYIEKFTDEDGYERFAKYSSKNSRTSKNDGNVDLSLGFPTEVTE